MRNKGFVTAFLMATGLAFGLPGTALAGEIARGESLANTCIACHGPGGVSAMPTMYPSLAGRDAGELADLLRAYRDGDLQDPQMTPHAINLSDQDIQDLAAYFAAQDPG